MFAETIISFRETLEAALAVGIMLAYLWKTGNWKHANHVGAGVVLGLAGSLAVAFALNSLTSGISESVEPIFEGSLMVFATAMITWFVVWAAWHFKSVREIEHRMRLHLGKGEIRAIALIAFASVLREGTELVLLTYAANAGTGPTSFAGIAAGSVAAIILVAAMLWGAKSIDTKLFFFATTALLVFFASGLLAQGVGEFAEAKILNPGPVVWDTSHMLSEDSALGSFAHSLFGYISAPTLGQLIVYAAYLLFGQYFVCRQYFWAKKGKLAGFKK